MAQVTPRVLCQEEESPRHLQGKRSKDSVGPSQGDGRWPETHAPPETLLLTNTHLGSGGGVAGTHGGRLSCVASGQGLEEQLPLSLYGACVTRGLQEGAIFSAPLLNPPPTSQP